MLKRFFLTNLFRLTALMVLPVLILGSALYSVVVRELREDIQIKNAYLLSQTQQVCDLIFQAFDSANVLVSSNYTMARALKRMSLGSDVTAGDLSALASFHNSIESIIGSNPYIYSVYVYLDRSDKFYSSQSRMTGINAGSDSQWLEAVSHAGNGVEKRLMQRTVPAMHDYERDRAVLTVFQRLFSGLSSVTGTAVINIDIEKLRQNIRAMMPYEGQEVFLVVEDEAFCITSTATLPAETVALMQSAEEGKRTVEMDGAAVFVNRIPMRQSGWTFMALTPARALYGVQQRIITVILIVAAVCIVLAIGFSRRIAKENYTNIYDILSAIDKAKVGEQPAKFLRKQQNVYTYIIQNIVQTGIVNQYMAMQVKEKKYQMKILEDAALQYQINPHFQINTLRTIYWKAVEVAGMDAPVSRMVEDMLDFMGYILSDPKAPVLLQDEVRHTKSFCEILSMRHEGEVIFHWDCPQELGDAVCCRLILQPYIENAFYHGLRGAQNKRRIDIKGWQENGDVCISISDDGAGMDEEKLREIRASLESEDLPEHNIGLCNPHRRIRLRFGEGYGVTVESRLGAGTRVMLRFPLMRDTANDA